MEDRKLIATADGSDDKCQLEDIGHCWLQFVNSPRRVPSRLISSVAFVCVEQHIDYDKKKAKFET